MSLEFVHLFVPPAILLLFSSVAVNRPRLPIRSHVRKYPRPPAKAETDLWWRNEYPWNHHTHPLSQICVGNLKTQDIRNDYALRDIPGKLGVVNNEKHTIEAKILDCSCGWFLLEFWNLCINRNRQKLYTIHVIFAITFHNTNIAKWHKCITLKWRHISVIMWEITGNSNVVWKICLD